MVGGEKGGVGKSVVARLLAQYWIDHKLAFAALDADASHPALLRSYAEASEPVDLRETESLDQIIERALEADQRVLVDLPAQASSFVRAWVEEGDVLALAREESIDVCLWHVTDGGFDSVELLGALARTYGKDVRYVVVRNHGRSRDFSQLDESAALAEIRALGGRVIDLPELHSAAMYRIDRHGSSLWAATHDSASPLRLPTMDRRRVKRWIEQAYEQFDQLDAWL